MNKAEFSKIYERVKRTHDVVYRKASTGFSQTTQNSDGISTRVEVVGLKSPDTLEDELLTLFVWLWSMKDYLKTLCKSRGIDACKIERIANENRSLSITADIANRAKHGHLKSSRSGDFAKLQNVCISIPQSALASITFEKPAVVVLVGIPEVAELFAEIGFDSGLAPVDAFSTALQATSAWETLAFPLAGV
jgi:hypothetical protein